MIPSDAAFVAVGVVVALSALYLMVVFVIDFKSNREAAKATEQAVKAHAAVKNRKGARRGR